MRPSKKVVGRVPPIMFHDVCVFDPYESEFCSFRPALVCLPGDTPDLRAFANFLFFPESKQWKGITAQDKGVRYNLAIKPRHTIPWAELPSNIQQNYQNIVTSRAAFFNVLTWILSYCTTHGLSYVQSFRMSAERQQLEIHACPVKFKPKKT